MARTDTLNNYLTDIATAIKTKKNDTTPIKASKFDEEIVNLPSGGGVDEYFVKDLKGQSNFLNRTIKKFPTVNMANITSLAKAFYYCDSLEEVEFLDTSNVTSMEETFYVCRAIKKIPPLDTSNVTNMKNTFRECRVIEELPTFDGQALVNLSSAFSFCNMLKVFNGFINLGQAYLTTSSANYSNYTFGLSEGPNLTHESLINIINNLYDIKTKGCNTQTLRLGTTNSAKLTADEIAIATNKGWTVS